GKGVDGAGFDPTSGNAFASNANGMLTVIHDPDHYRVIENVQTPQGGAQYGTRSHKSPDIHCFGEIRTAARGRPGKTAGASRIVHLDGDRARFGDAMTRTALAARFSGARLI